jgi:nicotinate-nucleotide adenylyltransferase
MRHIGLFGGTFNPVHTGHLLAADAVRDQLGLDEIRFLPAAYSPFKARPELSDSHRIAMLEHAVADYPEFKIDTRELHMDGPSYTINTLKSINGDSPRDRLYLLIGMDAWQDFEHWHKWQEILEICHIVVTTRPGYSPENLSDFWQAKKVTEANEIKGSRSGKMMFVSVPRSEAASSEIRKYIKKSQSTKNFLPDSVAQYIEEHQLYR